ncbi:ATP-binding protein [Prosthecobacter sp.]|uniref:sensor histidine kinase n=1 Tax=Prosthecobacter sp. TaxID=1965333 RepID=UPI002ABC7933|nr:ATP-binding protein [Prosthecobacter sp.]MDZ4402726.1 ATP-binding protein [Prosthecobacter sp.]
MKPSHSLRWRIQIWHGLLLVVVLMLSGVAAYRHQHTSELRRVDRELRERVAVIVDSLPMIGAWARHDAGATPPGRSPLYTLPPERAALFDPQSKPAFYFVVWKRDGTEWARSAGIHVDVPMPERPPPGSLGQVDRTRGDLREAFTFTPPGECLLVGRSTALEMAALREYLRGIITLGLAVLALGFGGGWWITSRALRPLQAITATAERISEGQLSERINAPERDSELGELAAVLDDTFAKLETSFTQQAQFTADAAHELCTPLSIIISHAQRGLRGERSAEENHELFDACHRAARRMEKLTTSLLALAQQDANAAAPDKQPCDLADLARETAALIRPAVDAKQLTLHLDLAPAACVAHADGTAQIILNLLTNALEHTPAGGSVTVKTSVDAGHATLAVTDTGPGIAAEHLPHLFERFYRADPSRSRSTGGAGLGLAISKAIADAHGAALEVASTVGAGSTFTLRLGAVSAEPATTAASLSAVLPFRLRSSA